jgi:Arc/MetJ-type ribon-helix-helix transcriptional regulator
MGKFDYSAPADLFPARSRNGHRPVGYRRFDTAAEAIRYAVEEMPAEFFRGTVLESSDNRLDGENIRLMYSSESYPLARKRGTAS